MLAVQMPHQHTYRSRTIPTKQHYTIYWIDGKREVVCGLDFDNALACAGYPSKVKFAIWKWEEGITTTYTWSSSTYRWY